MLQEDVSQNNISQGQYIIINSSTNKMGYYINGKLAREFNVATGKSSSKTPTGTYVIISESNSSFKDIEASYNVKLA